ncbi:MAG: hypothetical protein AABY22_27010 [Nanoarchaeota archaeon]
MVIKNGGFPFIEGGPNWDNIYNWTVTGKTYDSMYPALKESKLEIENKKFIDFFEKLGYKVDWNSQRGLCSWHDIYDKEELICQIQRWIPLEKVLEDFKNYKEDSGFSYKNGDYILAAENEEKLLELMEKALSKNLPA